MDYESLQAACVKIIQDDYFAEEVGDRINRTVSKIAGGIEITRPDGSRFLSPPLPNLFTIDSVDTATDAAYVALPDEYQRSLIYVADENDCRIRPPRGGTYYSWAKFMERASKKDLSQSGTISMVCVKGTNLYYQGIPSDSQELPIQFYQKPTDMDEADDTPDSIPDHLHYDLIVCGTCADMLSEMVGGSTGAKVLIQERTPIFDKRLSQFKSMDAKFWKAMGALVLFVGETDDEALFYDTDQDEDDWEDY